MDFSHEADASRAGTARQRGYKTPYLLDAWPREHKPLKARANSPVTYECHRVK